MIFSTKRRAPFVTPAIAGRLHAYLSGIIRENGCVTVQVGGVEDHIHLLFALSRTRSMAQVVEALKTGSTKWLKREGFDGFAWQDGYSAFSVDESRAHLVATYIRNQPEHHARRSFQAELRLLLRRHGVDFDERYLWD